MQSSRVRLAATAALLAGLPLAGAGCAALPDETGTGRRVVAAFYPLEYVADRVAGDLADVDSLTQPGGEPHDLELSVRETALVADADIIVVEHGFQPAVDTAVEENAEGAVLDVEDVVTLRPFAEHDHESGTVDGDTEEHAADDGHDHEGDLDPHFWLDPLLVADLGDALAAELGRLDPDHAATYDANAADLRADLEAVDRDYETGLARCARDVVVVSHDAFGYLARYGLHLEPIAGLSPEAEPTAADLARLQDLIRTEGVTTVFSETLASPELAETLASDMGVGTAVLDPIEGLSDRTADEDYLSLMQANLAALEEANGC